MEEQEQLEDVVGIEEPNRPSHYLLNRLARARDQYADEPSSRGISERRALLGRQYQNIEAIGSELLQRFAETCEKHGLLVKGELRFYVVGGRLTQKPLTADSDIDCAITITGGENLRPLYGEEPEELTKKKKVARSEFAHEVLNELARKYGFQLTETLETGEVITGSLLEPKEFGTSDEIFRSNSLPAVLVTRLRMGI